MNTEDNIEKLPDGITLNANQNISIDIDVDYATTNSTRCDKCNLVLESVLITSGGRHEGIIRVAGNSNNLWKNSLPKDKTRCIKMLDEILMAKLDTHKERHLQ